MSTPPPVTVGLPVYNGEKHLPATLERLLGQTYGDFELLIADNASTDGTEDICRQAAAQDGRIRYVRHDENRGALGNFNYVAQQARSPLFRFASHDDLVDTTMLERCIEAQRAEPDAVLWFPRALEIDQSGEVVNTFDDSLQLLSPHPHQRVRTFLDEYQNSNCLFGLMRTDALQSTRLLGDFLSADVVLLLELALRGRFIEVPERLFLRRWEDRSLHAKGANEIASYYGMRETIRLSLHFTIRLVQNSRGILAAPLGPIEKARCFRELGLAWGPRYWRVILGEIKAVMIAAVRQRVS